MTLKSKLLIMVILIGTIVLVLMGIWMMVEFNKRQMKVVQSSIDDQLELLDFSISSFIREIKNDVKTLSENELVRSREDEYFTNFLNANEATFEYDIGELEQSIINVLNSYRTTHDYVNSVYMGRENGSFIRSHPRNQPTQYDPRERPWYIKGISNPGKVLLTEPYQSVTTKDQNIGIVTALQEEDGEIFGVVGVDVTLSNLTDFISGFKVGHSGQFLLTDENGIIIANQDENILFTNIEAVLHNYADDFLQIETGILTVDDNYYFIYTSPELGWKITAIIPVSEIKKEVRELAYYPPLFSLLLTIILFTLLSSIGLTRFVTKPLGELNKVTQRIVKSGNLDHKLRIKQKDEIGKLGISFNEMIKARKQVEEALQQERDLAAAFGEAVAILGTTLEMDKVLDQILDQVSRVIPNDAVNIMLIKNDKAYIARSRGYEKYDLEERLTKTSFNISEIHNLNLMFETKEPVVIPDVDKFPDWIKVEGFEFLKSHASAPILVHGEVIGFLNIDSTKKNFYSKAIIEKLRTFANHAAIAIDNAQLHQQVQDHAKDLKKRVELATKEINQRADELETLYKVGKDIAATLDLDTMLQVIVDKAIDIVNGDRGTIQLISQEKNKILKVVSCGFSKNEWEEYSCKEFLESINGWVYQQKKPALSRNIQKDERNSGKAHQRAVANQCKSAACTPLMIGEDVIGTLTVIRNKKKKAFDENDLSLINMLAAQAAAAIQNARLYEQAQEADRLKSAFLASMSHELRTPLNSIIGFTGILLQGLVGNLNPEQTKQMRMVQSSANHLLELINDILDISKIEAGQLTISLGKFNLRETIEKVIQTVSPLANKKGLELSSKIGPKVGQIVSDRRRIEQILINLVNNAIKFTEKGKVGVICQVKGEWIETQVFDTGIGIKEEDQKLLFKPFQQVDTGLSREYEGTGLGLAICKRLVNKLGGEIFVESVAGKGSTFKFTLPANKKEDINEE